MAPERTNSSPIWRAAYRCCLYDTRLDLSKFYLEFNLEDYKEKMHMAFNWCLGDNRLHQIVYNPCTGGCYDGLEETHVNLNQGDESNVS